MVKRLRAKKAFWLAITLFVIANLSLGGAISAKQMEIKARDVDKIKMVLDMAQTVANISDLVIHNKDLLTILNTVIGSGKTGANVTYGLLVLSALNEMDLIDSVISQDYKVAARAYFNQVLDERTNLRSYWKGVSYDLPKVMSGYITGSMAALTLNSFAITEKTIAVFVEFNVLEKMKLYDGLWYYFDTRKQGNEPHKIAWEETKEVLSWTIKPSFSFRTINNFQNEKETQLEQQFLALYEKWAPYVTPFGVSEKYKKQVKEELSIVLIAAAKEKAALAKNELKPSLIDRLAQQLEKLKETTAALLSKINPFKAGVAINLPEESEEELTQVEDDPQPKVQVVQVEDDPQPDPQPEPQLPLQDWVEDDPQPNLQPIETGPLGEEEIIIASTTTTPELSASTTEPVPKPKPTSTLVLPPTPTPGPMLCERDSGNPTRYRVLINEVAWMGTANSTNDEWIELKNVWGIPVKLSGWQFLDKDRQIKIIFGENDIIPAGGYYLLERTDDNSMPDARADLIYAGALGNTDEALYLFDDQCNIEDEVLANPNWPDGDNLLKKPMARFDVLNWYASASTPGGENSSPPAIHTAVSVSTPAPAPSPASPQIFITEMYIGSEGNQKDDFVELYNPNLEAIDLTDYYIQRKTESAQDFSTYISHELLAAKTIEAKNYFLIANASSTFATSADVATDYPLTENNDLVLKNPEQEIIDRVATNEPPAGKSYGRKWSSTTLNYTEDFEVQVPTPRTQNQNSETVEESNEDENEDGETDLLSVVINEIAWAGTEANSFDEWLELFVNSTTTLDGWKVLAIQNGTTTIEIPLAGFASSSTYILIERTDENTISDTPANFFFTGSLNNDGLKLELRGTAENIIDSVDCSANWFAGDNTTKQTMERINPLAGSDLANWANNNLITKNGLDADSNPINGTPGAENSVAKSSTEVTGGLNITDDFTLTLLGSPYLVEGSITVGATAKLTIEPGVIIKLKHNEYWHSEFRVNGELEAIGGDADNQKIIFTSFFDATGTTPAAGDWEWLYFENAQAKLNNVIIRYAGKREGNPPFSPPFTRGTLYINGGNIEISNSKIEESQTLGIWLTNSASATIDDVEFLDADGDWEKAAAVYIENSSPTIKNSTFKNNKIGVWLENGNNSSFENNVFEENEIPIRTATLLPNFSGNTAQNNNFNGILVNGLGFADSISEIDWQPDDLPYIIESSVTILSGKTLNIKSGVIIKFKDGGYIYVEGILNAQGTEEKKIVFTSLNDDEYGGDTNNDGADTQPAAGYWHSIYFFASSANSVLDNVIIRYGGWYNTFLGGAEAKSGAVKVNGATLIIKNSVFENNVYGGLELINSASEVQDTVFRGHTADYFWGQRSAGLMIRDSAPDFENTIFNNNYHGIYVESGECPDLTGVTFGKGDEANSVDVFPSSCAP